MNDEDKNMKKEIINAPTKEVINQHGTKLYPFQKKGDPRSDELRARQKGQILSSSKKTHLDILHLKQTKNPKKIEQRALAMINNPVLQVEAILSLQNYLLESDKLTDTSKVNLLKAMCDVFKTFHGTSYNVKVGEIDFKKKLEMWIEARNDAIKNTKKEEIKNE